MLAWVCLGPLVLPFLLLALFRYLPPCLPTITLQCLLSPPQGGLPLLSLPTMSPLTPLQIKGIYNFNLFPEFCKTRMVSRRWSLEILRYLDVSQTWSSSLELLSNCKQTQHLGKRQRLHFFHAPGDTKASVSLTGLWGGRSNLSGKHWITGQHSTTGQHSDLLNVWILCTCHVNFAGGCFEL